MDSGYHHLTFSNFFSNHYRISLRLRNNGSIKISKKTVAFNTTGVISLDQACTGMGRVQLK